MQNKHSLERRAASHIRKNPISLLALILALGALFYSYGAQKKTADGLQLLHEEITKKQEEMYANLDSKSENIEEKILKLKQEGYIEQDDFSDLSKAVLQATVLIAGASDIQALASGAGSALIQDMQVEKAGTGFFISKTGTIVTARHVVQAIGKDSISIKTSSGEIREAEVIREDEQLDIAVLKIEGVSPAYIDFGYDENITIGEEIGFAGYSLNTGVGDPLIYRGVVSAKGVDENGSKLFTINAFVNKGNSGGPVFSAKTGRVLGIINARQRDIASNKFISLPEGYAPIVKLGNIDPLQLSVNLYNKTLEVVGDVSQVGIGVAYSADAIRGLIEIN